uniref:Uncharacterized protein n=1 Tax=Oryza nivara TaxID=4536 RepID=A0A0E0JBL4_ORYNI
MRSAAAVRWCGHATVGNDEASSRNGEEEEETEAEGGAQASAPIRSRRRSGPSAVGKQGTSLKGCGGTSRCAPFFRATSA